ncbi:hypothetical protein C1H46_041436 [Malus baccata]|uniref:Uncharacterized protein n=1 Tax=Malus baccata TaxID=106549 RepID=A0A540KFN6_MALBA|nr:hypothetical protein C1H46_041436 [Malus baccata]
MAESRIGLTMWSSVANRNSGTEFGDMWFIGCRFRLRSAFDPYSVACEAFSEHCGNLILVVGVVSKKI